MSSPSTPSVAGADAAVMSDVCGQRCSTSTSRAGLQSRQFPAHVGDAGADQGLVADQPEGEADQDRQTSLVTTTEVLAQENPEDGGVEQGAYQSCGPHLVRCLQQFHKQVLARRPSCALSPTLTSPAVRVGERARYVKQAALVRVTRC